MTAPEAWLVAAGAPFGYLGATHALPTLRDLATPRALHLQARVSARAPGLIRTIGAVHGFVYERTQGRWLARRSGLPILLLETIGLKSGLRRRTPLCYLAVERGFAVIPANGGARRAPAWWLNLSAAGEAIVTVGFRRHSVHPVTASDQRRERLWRRFLAAYPELEAYRASAARELPIVVLEPVAEQDAQPVTEACAGEGERVARQTVPVRAGSASPSIRRIA